MSVLNLTVSDIDGTTVPQDLFDLFKFQGYDPAVTFEQLKKNANANGVTPDQFKQYIKEILMFYVIRGAKTSSNSAKKTSEAGRDRIEKAMQKLGIQNIRPAAATDINIARVIGVFVVQTAQIIKAYPDRVRATKIVEGGSQGLGLPNWACFPQVAAIIPDQATLQKFKDYMVQFDRVINGPNAEPQNKRLGSRQAEIENYVQITYNSQYFSTASRQTIWNKLSAN